MRRIIIILLVLVTIKFAFAKVVTNVTVNDVYDIMYSGKPTIKWISFYADVYMFNVGSQNTTKVINEAKKLYNINITDKTYVAKIITMEYNNNTQILKLVIFVNQTYTLPDEYYPKPTTTFLSYLEPNTNMSLYTSYILNISTNYFDYILKSTYFVRKYITYSNNTANLTIYDIWNMRIGVCHDYTRILNTFLNYVGIESDYLNGFLITNDGNYIGHQVLLINTPFGHIVVDPTNYNIHIPKYTTPDLFVPITLLHQDNWSDNILILGDSVKVTIRNITIDEEDEKIIMSQPHNSITYIKSPNTSTVVVLKVKNEKLNITEQPYFIPKNYGIATLFSNFNFNIIGRNYDPLTIEGITSIVFTTSSNKLTFKGVFDKVILITNGTYYIPIITPNGVTYTIENYTIDKNDLYVDGIKIYVDKIVNNRVQPIVAFKNDIDSYTYVLYTNDTKIINKIHLLYQSASIITYGNYIIITLRSNKILLPDIGIEISYNQTTNLTKNVTYYFTPNGIVMRILFNTTNIPQELATYLSTTPILIKEDNNYVLKKGTFTTDGVDIEFNINELSKNLSIYLNNVIDVNNYLRMFKQINIENYKVIAFTLTNVTINFTIDYTLDDNIPQSLIRKITKYLNGTYMDNVIETNVIKTFPLDVLTPGNKLIIHVNFGVVNITLPTLDNYTIKNAKLKLIKNNLENNTTTIQLVVPNTNLSIKSVLFFNELNYILYKGKTVKIEDKFVDDNKMIFIFTLEQPIEHATDIKIPHVKSFYLDYKIIKKTSIYDRKILLYGVFFTDEFSCNVDYLVTPKKDHYEVLLNIKNLKPVECHYMNNTIKYVPTVPYVFSVRLVDMDVYNDIKSPFVLYKGFTKVYLQVDVTDGSDGVVVEIDGVNITTVTNSKVLLLDGIVKGVGNHTLRIYDYRTGILIDSKTIRIVNAPLSVIVERYSVLGLIIVLFILIVFLKSYVEKKKLIISYTDSVVKQYYPYAELVDIKTKKKWVILTYIDKKEGAVIKVKYNTKTKKVVTMDVYTIEA